MSDCCESEYANKHYQMCELFPNLKCSPDASHFDKLDEILVYSDTATICDEPDHFCYSGLSDAMRLEYTNIIHINLLHTEIFIPRCKNGNNQCATINF